MASSAVPHTRGIRHILPNNVSCVIVSIVPDGLCFPRRGSIRRRFPREPVSVCSDAEFSFFSDFDLVAVIIKQCDADPGEGFPIEPGFGSSHEGCRGDDEFCLSECFV